MRNIILATLLSLSVVILPSCSDMMDVDSDRVLLEKNNTLDNPNDSIYSIMGVLSKLQVIADRCVIMGELRGDLMVTEPAYASTSLQDIEAFNFTTSNEFAIKRDFYDVINNCNFIISRMDTTIVEGQVLVMKPEYAQTKVIRAWTYLQMALIFGKVNYITEPLLSVDDVALVAESGQEMDLDQLTLALIDDIEPFADVRPLDYGGIDGWSSSQFFIPTKMLLGDLYRYNNNYERAAFYYASLINHRNLIVDGATRNTWESTSAESIYAGHLYATRNEIVTRLVFNSDLRSLHSNMSKYTYNEQPALLPASWFTEKMEQTIHFHTSYKSSVERHFSGDLRGYGELKNGTIIADAFGPVSVDGTQPERMLITKYYNSLNGSAADELEKRPLTTLPLYRPTTVYLRLAESMNRMGYPSMAFATLKYGLKNSTISDTLKVDSNEVKMLPDYLDFTDGKWDNNNGTSMRGRGMAVVYDKDLYVIPAGVDTVAYVEEAILEEMAAETCFEGNRFFDLLCISRHRADHPAFLAEKVSKKYADPEAMKAIIADPKNWWAK